MWMFRVSLPYCVELNIVEYCCCMECLVAATMGLDKHAQASESSTSSMQGCFRVVLNSQVRTKWPRHQDIRDQRKQIYINHKCTADLPGPSASANSLCTAWRTADVKTRAIKRLWGHCAELALLPWRLALRVRGRPVAKPSGNMTSEVRRHVWFLKMGLEPNSSQPVCQHTSFRLLCNIFQTFSNQYHNQTTSWLMAPAFLVHVGDRNRNPQLGREGKKGEMNVDEMMKLSNLLVRYVFRFEHHANRQAVCSAKRYTVLICP